MSPPVDYCYVKTQQAVYSLLRRFAPDVGKNLRGDGGQARILPHEASFIYYETRSRLGQMPDSAYAVTARVAGLGVFDEQV